MMKYRVTSRLNSSSLRSSLVFTVVLLDNTKMRIKFDASKNVKGSELFEGVCEKATIQGPYRKYFGLQYISENDGKKDWLRQDDVATQCSSVEPRQFQLAVKVFPNDLFDLDQVVQKLIVLQVKENISCGRLWITKEEHAILDSYFAQGILGNFNEKCHSNGYLERLLGPSFYSQPNSPKSFSELARENIYGERVKALHKSHYGMTPSDCFKAFLVLSVSIFGYGAFVYKRALDMNGKEFILTISFKGIQIYFPNSIGEPKELVDEFPWANVITLVKDCSKFLFSVCSAQNQTSKSLQMHSFRFKGHYGHLQAERILADANYHRDLVLGLKSMEKRKNRSRSFDENSVRLDRLLLGRNINRKITSVLKC